MRVGLDHVHVFATDVVQGMGLTAPRHWMTTKGEPATVGKGYELTANLLWDWLHAQGATYGWMSADREVAEKAAPVVGQKAGLTQSEARQAVAGRWYGGKVAASSKADGVSRDVIRKAWKDFVGEAG